MLAVIHQSTAGGLFPLFSFFSSHIITHYFVKLCKYFFSHEPQWNARVRVHPHLIMTACLYCSHSQSPSEPLGKNLLNAVCSQSALNPQGIPNLLRGWESPLVKTDGIQRKFPEILLYYNPHANGIPSNVRMHLYLQGHFIKM